MLTKGDEVISTAQLMQPGEFSFTISYDHSAVKVEASRKGSPAVSASCYQGCQPVFLEMK